MGADVGGGRGDRAGDAATSTGGIIILMPLRAFDEPLIHRKISNPEPPPVRGAPAQYIPRRIDSRSVFTGRARIGDPAATPPRVPGR